MFFIEMSVEQRERAGHQPVLRGRGGVQGKSQKKLLYNGRAIRALTPSHTKESYFKRSSIHTQKNHVVTLSKIFIRLK